MVQVSVVMPVYNGEKYLRECMDSVLSQSFRDFELLVINDGSTDCSAAIVNGIKDSRIKWLDNKHDFIDSLNQGVNMARGKYIARMDADDRMCPGRLAAQYELMEQRPDVAVCASWFRTFGQQTRSWCALKGDVRLPLVYMLRGNIIAHPTVMLRKEFLLQHALQYEYYPYAEDFKLWSEIAKREGVFYVIPEFLLDYRLSDEQVSRQKAEEQYETTISIRTEIVEFLLERCPQKQKEEFTNLSCSMERLNAQGLLSEKKCFDVFFELFGNVFSPNVSG